MIRDFLLAVGLLLAPATQLRIAGFPIGPGETCLAIWLVLRLGREAIWPSLPTRVFWQTTVFWAIFITAQSIGTAWGIATGAEYDGEWVLHDVMAYMLLAPISCLSVLGNDVGAHLRRTTWGFTILGTGSLGLQLAQGVGLISIPGIDPWFWGRFRGWSANPNQLALLCAVLGLLALYLADTATSRAEQLLAGTCLILPIYVGRITGSDTFTLILLTTGPIFIAMKLRSWLRTSRRQVPFRVAFAWLCVIAFPVLVVSTVPIAVFMESDPERLIVGLAKNNGKEAAQEAELRFSLWYEALDTGVKGAMLGLGPGPHLEIPASIVAARNATPDRPENLKSPTQHSAPNYEAHNTLLDLFTQGGLIAVLTFVWLQAKAFLAAYRADMAGLIALFAGLCLFGMTSLIARHPMYWFAVALCLVQEAGSRPIPVILRTRRP